MKKILIPGSNNIININKIVCSEGDNPHHCFSPGKIESAIHSAFYPGSYPFAAGGVVQAAGALCFYLIKTHAFMDGNKRTAALSAIVFLNKNGWTVKYPLGNKVEKSALTVTMEDCAQNKITKEELIKWFDTHKIKL